MDLAILARINSLFAKQRGAVKISNYLESSLIEFLDVSTRNDAIDSLIRLLDKAGKLPNRDQFRKAIFEREELISTGIGMGVEMDHRHLAEAMLACHSGVVGPRDGVVTAEDDRDRT